VIFVLAFSKYGRMVRKGFYDRTCETGMERSRN
jgi:hypothetical protein